MQSENKTVEYYKSMQISFYTAFLFLYELIYCV